MALKKKTINLLRKIEEQILEEPKRLQMGHWGATYAGNDAKANHVPPCNTTACIAGWTVLLSKPALWRKMQRLSDGFLGLETSLGQDPQFVAEEILGIGSDASWRLFFLNRWPKQFQYLRKKHYQQLTFDQRAKLAVARIEHFIATDGNE